MCLIAVPAVAGLSATMASAMATASVAATVASTALSAYGAIQQSHAQATQAKYNAAVAHNNRIIAQQNAQDALDRGAVEEQQQRKKTQLLIGQQRSSLAAQGADLSSGSALDLVGDIAGTGELDALTIRRNATLEARQYQIQGMNFQADSQLQRMQAANAKTSGYFDLGTSLLGGVSKIGGLYI
ncbi:MAG TPA: hypothetical protein VM639_01575 [Dongiaceae bacterium]|nr:hypothetical protein [Dongiaceae bacterium]